MSLSDVRITWPNRPTHPPALRSPAAVTVLRFPAAPDQAMMTAQLWAGDALATLDRLAVGGTQVDLIHLDPPFGSEAAYDRRVTLQAADLNLTLRAYDDRDGQDLPGYLEMLYPVLSRAHAVLAEHGSLYLHLDPRRGPHARLLLDEIFGPDNFVNQIIWAYALGGSSRRHFQRKHDVIYLYARHRKKMYFAAPQEEATSSLMAGRPKLATDTWETTDRADDADLLRDWPDELVRKTLSNRDPERTGYPTQKPLTLALRMVSASCPPGGLVVDPMSGSATLAVAAVLLGRHAIAGDRGNIARDVARARLLRAGASVRIDSLDQHCQVSTWTGPPPVTIAGDRAQLHTPEFPAELAADVAAAVVGVAAQERLLALAASDGAALWSGWGVASNEDPTTLLAWADAGPGRSRPSVAPSLELPPAAAAIDGDDGPTPRPTLVWWGIDVLGRLWHWSPQDSSPQDASSRTDA